MTELHTEMIMAATAKRVWDVLTDFAAYPEWNPLIVEASGDLVEGKKLRVRLKSGKRTIVIKPKLLRVVPNKVLTWRGSLPIPGLFTGEHSFELDEEVPGQTRFHHWEKFNGLLVPVLGKMLEKTKRGFEQMNVALDRRATAE
jgi:hypothetical protein